MSETPMSFPQRLIDGYGAFSSDDEALLGTVAAEILNLVVTLGFTAFASVLSAVGYYYLRAEKEGIVIDDIARVFD